MLEILFSWLSPLRFIGIWIDTIAFSLVDNAYELIVTFSSGTLLKQEFVQELMDNFYVIIGLFALFRVAILLVNSLINPEKLTEKGNGISNILVNFLVMFVLLVATPIIFKEALDLQSVIVKGNYVQKLFINANALKNKDPGKAMRSIAIGSLITIDKEALEIYEAGKCSKNCKKAIEDYKKMEKNGFSFPTISKHIGVSIKNDDGETVYVYNYMFIVTFVAGCFITYVLLSFAIDIAIRMVELTVLQVLAPLFIATYIDPKSAKSGTFHKWLATVGKTYASLFIKLAIVALMLLLISVVGNLDHYTNNLKLGGIEKFVLLVAILIFAKKAPGWLTGMIGIEGEGLGGLGIGKKLGGAALVGGAIGKGLDSAKKFGGQKAKNFAANRARNTLARAGGMIEAGKALRNRKDSLSDSEKGFRGHARTMWNQGRAAAKQSKDDNYGKDFKDMKDITSGFMAGRLNVNPQAISLKDKLTDNFKEKNAAFQDKVGNTDAKRAAAQKIANDNKAAKKLYNDKIGINPATGDRLKAADGKYIYPQGNKEMNEAFGYPTTVSAAYKAFGTRLAQNSNGEYTLSSDGMTVTTKDGKTMSIYDFGEQKMSHSGRLAVASLVADNVQREVANYETSKVNLSNARQDYASSVIQYNQATERFKNDERVINANRIISDYEQYNQTKENARQAILSIRDNSDYTQLKDRDYNSLTPEEQNRLASYNVRIKQEEENYNAAVKTMHDKENDYNNALDVKEKAKGQYGLVRIEEQMKSSMQLIEAWSEEVGKQEKRFKEADEFKFNEADGTIMKDKDGKPVTYNPFEKINVNGEPLNVVENFIKINEIKSVLNLKASKAKEKYEKSIKDPE